MEKLKEEKTEENPIENAQEVLSKLEAQNDRMEKNLERAEKLAATNLLSGTANAGQTPEPVKEETPQEYAQKVMAGELNG